MKILKLFLITLAINCLWSCKKFLNVVPDDIATIDQAFQLRATAKKYLFTCYSFIPPLGDVGQNYTLLGSREIATPYPGSQSGLDNSLMELAYDYQNIATPIDNCWDGPVDNKGGVPLFTGIRTCNIFLENVAKIPDIQDVERSQWIAEVKVLKAYYHFLLLRMYGPIPVIRENLPVSADVNTVKVYREPVDTAVNYIAGLIDEAKKDLPLTINNQRQDLGRITQPIALAIKAYAMVLNASPLFNGNSDYAGLVNKGIKGGNSPLVNTAFDISKWDRAATACSDAINSAQQAGFQLYHFTKPFDLNPIGDTTQKCMDIRGAITDQWNQEVIWAFTNTNTDNLQRLCAPRNDIYSYTISLWAANLNAAEIFYTNHGVPIDEDPAWDYANRYSLTKIIPDTLRAILKPNYTTSVFNMDREYRFYADLAFDGSSYFIKQRPDESNLLYINTMWGSSSANSLSRYSFTGYWPKKLVSWKTGGDGGSYSPDTYYWPAIRLSTLYLMYAEALNESKGPSATAYQYIDLVRQRAGLSGVVESWANYSRNAAKPSTREGLRSIIQQETMIELIFEGENYWNMRRWKRLDLMNRPVTGWSVLKNTPAEFYNMQTIYQPHNTYRDYLAPIKQDNLYVNPNLVQNPLW